ncbi:pyridoxine 5'-phosphate synthase [Ketobacter sp. MCCC 1A13808]|uniref:pyridoxine 5'-phosphate synthase n=1 Tax=Ketobacter sp. MCCC 1A13808 TaxID=2602738 RepID=UPI000F20E0CA|nr:pyridoxine 5'-phosphate synthase [Ketobacter sp. MCCC 1A13808]MVF14683.1 pyridoxine 5'-phosphate synthase [Ketobacter sp. MCCC 1A13808]RLP53949.1 MAG: pyridoxine 5'-phosphate synthase [Ketobacter sp.]
MTNSKLILLGVNVDHVATLRQARGTRYPDPVQAALLAEEAGADGITIHLREDRRHIQERDVHLMMETLNTRMNLELAVTDEMIGFAESVRPPLCCLVPEKREELTTEGGLDVAGQLSRVREAVSRLSAAGCEVSLFIDADPKQIEAATQVAAPVIELHTGRYAECSGQQQLDELNRIVEGTKLAQELGLTVNAGHGLYYHNVIPVAAIPGINELNIGHGIISRSMFTGLKAAVQDMKQLMLQARQ